MKEPKDYYSTHMVAYDARGSYGHITMPVLQFMWGQPWDQLALNMTHTLDPYAIRVTYGETKTDACRGRVTVVVEPKDGIDIIKYIEQEVAVATTGLPEDERCGHGIYVELRKRGIDFRKLMFGE